jgi:integrase
MSSTLIGATFVEGQWSRMVYDVRVRQPAGAPDSDLLAEALGEAPLPVVDADRVAAPWITINGRIHAPSSYFLWHHCRAAPNLKTATAIASGLARWLRFLVNDRGLLPHEDHRDPVLVATEDDFAAFYRRSQYPDAYPTDSGDGGGGRRDTVIGAQTSDSWRDTRSAVKRLYEYLRRQHAVTPPFELVTVTHWTTGWRGTGIAGYAPRRRSTGSRGTPIDPHFAQLLLQAALRIDNDGAQETYLGADRDQAILALGLATGIRRNNLANVATYELPAAQPGRDFTVMRVADFITKGDAGGDAFTFAHYLPAIWDYVNGRRAELVAAIPYRPARPLHIQHADNVKVRYRDPDRPADGTQIRTWTTADAQFRRRLVDVDGSSPVLFLGEYTAEPLAYDSLSNVIETARTFAATRLDPTFPTGFRIHDLRHTYAVHLLLAIYHGAIARNLPPRRRAEYQVDHLSAALELVKASLGHASEDSTRLYLATAHRFLDVPADHFLGRF